MVTSSAESRAAAHFDEIELAKVRTGPAVSCGIDEFTIYFPCLRNTDNPAARFARSQIAAGVAPLSRWLNITTIEGEDIAV